MYNLLLYNASCSYLNYINSSEHRPLLTCVLGILICYLTTIMTTEGLACTPCIINMCSCYLGVSAMRWDFSWRAFTLFKPNRPPRSVDAIHLFITKSINCCAVCVLVTGLLFTASHNSHSNNFMIKSEWSRGDEARRHLQFVRRFYPHCMYWI